MKKLILVLLLFTTALLQAQTYPSPQYNVTTTNTLKIKTPATVTSVNFLSTIETDGSVAKINPVNLPFSLKQNFINIKDLGGIGDGVFNNTTIINNALLNYKEVYFPDGNYLVTSLVNDLGAKITGSGIIVKAITGGQQQLNTGIDRYNYVSGQEYLSFVQNKIMALGSKSTAGIKVSWSGDSTTAGDAVSDTGFILSNLFLATARKNSIAAVTSLNRGHSGANTEQWRTTYIATDLAENPDLYIVRWGINDASRGLDAFKTSLRTGLATIRASKSQSQLSIILMSPNSTSDTPNGRDEKWYEQVRKIYIQAARDYKCAFIDTYSLWLDSRGAADIYMDNPYGDGRAIHPFNVFNGWIVSKVFDLVFPTSLKVKISSGYLINESSADRLPALSDLPESYQKGFSLSRAYQPTGLWAVDGTALTFFNTDGTGLQLNSSRLTDVPEIYFRSFKGEYSTETLSWSNNVRMWHSGNLTNPVTGSGTANFIAKWTGTNTQGNSQIFDNASSVGINTTSPVGKFHVKVATDLNVFFSNSSSKVGVTAVNDAVSANVPLIVNASTIELASSGTTKLTVSSSGTTVNNLTGSGDATTIVDATGLLKRGDAVISGVKRYNALISQTGTSAPSVTVLENSLGGTVVWTRGSTGSYTGTLSSAFTSGKTIVFANTATTSRIITCGSSSTSTVFFLLQDNSGTPTDGSTQISYKVEVYP